MVSNATVEAMRRVGESLWQHMPIITGSLILLLVGWGIARIVGGWVRRLGERGLERVAARPVIGGSIDAGGALAAAPRLVGALVFWVVLLVFAAAAVEVVGLPVMTDLIGRIAAYLPNLVAAAVIGIAGLIGARAARAAVARAAENAGLSQAGATANAVHAVVLVIALVIAVQQLGVNGRILELTLAVTVGATLAAAALAFGLGARASVANIIGARYVSELFGIGQSVRIDDVEGTVAQLTTTAVVIDTTDGRVVVPASRFHEARWALLSKES
jgi:small-conductance mechanosensitive channel